MFACERIVTVQCKELSFRRMVELSHYKQQRGGVSRHADRMCVWHDETGHDTFSHLVTAYCEVSVEANYEEQFVRFVEAR